jgi:hypothetical protein
VGLLTEDCTAKGPTLEEIAKIFDGTEAEVGVADLSDVKADMRGGSVDEKDVTGLHLERVGSQP